jgi:hypothetical protein
MRFGSGITLHAIDVGVSQRVSSEVVSPTRMVGERSTKENEPWSVTSSPPAAGVFDNTKPDRRVGASKDNASVREPMKEAPMETTIGYIVPQPRGLRQRSSCPVPHSVASAPVFPMRHASDILSPGTIDLFSHASSAITRGDTRKFFDRAEAAITVRTGALCLAEMVIEIESRCGMLDEFSRCW